MTQPRTAIVALVLAASAFSLSACRKSSDSADKKAESTATTSTAEDKEDKKASRPTPPPVDEGIDVPTEEDFEETAQTMISETADLDKELDRLEKEIGK